MAQWIKARAGSPENLSSIPEIHTVKGRTDSQELSADLQISTKACIYTYTKINKSKNPMSLVTGR